MKPLDVPNSPWLLRPLRIDDLDSFFAYRKLEDLCKYQGFDPFTLEDCKKFIEKHSSPSLEPNGKWNQIGIAEKLTGELLGDCAVNIGADHPDTAELGVTVRPDQQGKGCAKTVMKALISHLFHQCGVRRIHLLIAADNQPSIALAKSVGFRQEGHLIESYELDGEFRDEFVFGLLKQEWGD